MSYLSAVAAFFTWKPVRWTLLSLLDLIVAAVAVLYGGSEWRMARTYDRPTIALRTTEPASAERGARLATIFTCTGCHGEHGRVFIDEPAIGRLIAPDIARKVADYTDDELIVLLRAGIRRDGTSTLVMPTGAFSSMSDADL